MGDASRVSQAHPSLATYAQKESFWHLLDTMQAVATSAQCSPAQVAIAWLLARPSVASVVIGARTMEQLLDNMHGAHVNLSQDQVGVVLVWSCFVLSNVFVIVTSAYSFSATGLRQF